MHVWPPLWSRCSVKVTLCITCHVDRFLQRKFDEGGPQAVARVLPEILDHLTELMVGPLLTV